MAFSPDGKSILTSSSDHTARLWDADYRAFIVYACTQVWRDFTTDERQQFSLADNEPTCPKFASALIDYNLLNPVFDGPLTTPLPPTWTPLPVTLPVFTPVASPTP